MKSTDAFAERVFNAIRRLESMVVSNSAFQLPARPYTTAVLRCFDDRQQRQVVRALRTLERAGRIACLDVPDRKVGQPHKYWRTNSLLEAMAFVASGQKSKR